MTSKRDTQTYELWDRNGKKVYIGTTNDPEGREQQHRKSGKKFASLKVTSIKMTPEGARNKEKKQLETYRGNHKGRNPKYNKDNNG